MNRRAVLQRIAATAAGLIAVPATLAAARPSRVLLQESPLAGFQYYDGERLWPRLRAGQALTLRRRADNPHNKRAVEVWWRSRMLGHLPRVENTAVSQMPDRGEHLTAHIVALARDGNPWNRIRLAVEWAG